MDLCVYVCVCQMVWIWQKLFFGERYISTTNNNPDFVALAKAYGIDAVSCDNSGEPDRHTETARRTHRHVDICVCLVCAGFCR